ncbi:MAG: peroxiredoxin [endosymbiont of Galathealinum brachiosum]|uniref:thioredoxin-dependent peroxiredoxin n=1 Tax=endosymbiont of Galathealinum brachiosum TaxID=2200906 RepID=A0A370DKA7_9GAMM|nr:MAG: peroxiredoxin [endosymbiont of Galathealinum brachiosum]
MLQTNSSAPNLTSTNQNNEPVSLSDFNNKKNIVLYFYPKDDTPGCTIEANQFTELADEFNKADTIIFGVSKDDCNSHQAFINKFNLKIDLLADTSGELCEAYGVWQEKEKNGIKKMGIVRSTFIINKEGNLIDVEYGVSAEGHAANVLEKIKNI